MTNTRIYYREDTCVQNKLVSKIRNGEVIVPSIKINEEITLPESICKVDNFKINYPYDLNNLNINTINAEPLDNFEVQSRINDPVNLEKIKVENVIRTKHMNGEEKAKILKLCYNYRQVFYNPKEI